MTSFSNRSAAKFSLGRTIFVAGTMLALVLVAWGAADRTGSSIPKAQAAHADYFLKIEGVDGESQDPQYPGTIEVDSWSWGATNSGGTHSGSGLSAGKVSFQDLHFTTKVSKASPLLMLAVAKGKHFPKATLVVRKAGSDQQDYYKVTLSDVLVSSYQSSGDGTTDVPVDAVSLNFAKIEFSYSPQSTAGAASSPVKASWDIKANKGA